MLLRLHFLQTCISEPPRGPTVPPDVHVRQPQPKPQTPTQSGTDTDTDIDTDTDTDTTTATATDMATTEATAPALT